MSSAAPNPRRRAARPSDPDVTPSLVDSFQNMSIRKGDTFHPQTNTSKSSFWDPLESASSSMTVTRSTTSPQALEDLLIGAGERRVANLLDRVDKAIAAQSKVALSNVLSEPEVLPVPTFMVDTPESAQKTRTRHHSHSSDSGLGSSVADSTESTESSSTSTAKNSTHTATGTPGRQSLSTISNASDEERGLSKYAADQIHKHIVQPILDEESLKEFHGLIKSVPSRIGDKEIKNLRELEKTLIFLAPNYSRSPSKYLRFCERTIRVLHTTVTTLHESDQRAPTDRPYTQGYFFELVEQIRRYATILAATRAKQAKGEKLGPMDVTEDERVSIHGGMSHNGKPAELVRHTADGKVISVTTGQPLSEEEIASSSAGPMQKRPADEIDEDDALRSMARRKKNAKPEIHTCELCQKEFKRPCDLTKHVKTHERPWKCPNEDCKYYEYGWPTEKERDRHVNDKHSSTPSLYHCLYKPCPYTSKRESNCKQHMEKAHGWNYVRSKSNGKGHASNAMRLQQGSVPPSPASAMLTPLTPIAPSPSTNSMSEASRRGSMAPPSVGPSNYGTPAFTHPSPDFAGHFNMNNMNFDFNDMANYPAFPITPATSDDRRASASLSSHSGAMFDASSFDNGTPDDFMFDNFNFGNFDFSSYTPNSSIAGPSSNAAPQASPGAQMDQTFTNDAMNVDGVYDTNYNDYSSGPNQDFTLFGATAPATSGDMFPSLPAEGSWGNLDNMGSNFGSHFDAQTTAPALTTGNSTLEELFPELKNQR
ncbi:hypothetical protein M409DRAFT_30426 [Zasmidium cellare ATCC 36951]|uniref:C2H2-type domain-containing protein n=1 Tax=Zasmidium cellare ATCC 36951 TaxID=1080233 RepID=A0A6A6BZX6_ZASCE|nr:uncharacterized protein M409DRAFT_30426 [Zasmidium cellare ATCC 36951]KAF2159142.1 hypothetical protein M409DRAFT_30426 [Zasmidium cellare ATCC 36951]